MHRGVLRFKHGHIHTHTHTRECTRCVYVCVSLCVWVSLSLSLSLSLSFVHIYIYIDLYISVHLHINRQMQVRYLDRCVGQTGRQHVSACRWVFLHHTRAHAHKQFLCLHPSLTVLLYRRVYYIIYICMYVNILHVFMWVYIQICMQTSARMQALYRPKS